MAHTGDFPIQTQEARVDLGEARLVKREELREGFYGRGDEALRRDGSCHAARVAFQQIALFLQRRQSRVYLHTTTCTPHTIV
jgi:hypothetical protein